MTAAERICEVSIVGGGTAGLSTALTLARARRDVVVVDSAEPRNQAADHLYGYLSRDGIPPLELHSIGRDEVMGYGAEIVHDAVQDVSRTDGLYVLRTQHGRTIRSRRLVLATGAADVLPDVPGVRELWGSGVVSCPYCHGWEARDQKIAVLGTGERGARLAITLTQWSKEVLLFNHGASAESFGNLERFVDAAGVSVADQSAVSVERQNGALQVRIASGDVIALDRVFVAAGARPRIELFKGLGGTVYGSGLPIVDPSGRSDAVPGCWIVGNAANPAQQSVMAAAHGTEAAQSINMNLMEEDLAARIPAAE